MSERHESWKEYDELNRALNEIKKRYAKQAVRKAHEVLGDSMFIDASRWLAAHNCFDAGYHIAMEFSLYGHKNEEKRKKETLESEERR